MSKEIYLRTDELTDAIKSLEMTEKLVSDLLHDPYVWKWFIIALHMSLQGFMVNALKGSSGLDVVTDKSAKEWHEAYRAGRKKFPKQKLDYFLNLYKKIKGDRMLKYHGSQKFVSTEQQDRNVRKLSKLRNDFIHFQPMIWLIPKDRLPQIAKDCLSVIRFLALNSGTMWHRKGYSAPKIEGLINHIDAVMDELARQEPDL